MAEQTEARELLHKNGFDAKDAEAVVRAARKNRIRPLPFARRAIALREHVTGGCSL